MTKRILLLSQYRYPNGDAGSHRQHAFAKLAQSLGMEPTVLGLGESTGFQATDDEVPYISLKYPGGGMLPRLKSRLFYKKNLARFLRDNSFDICLTWDLGRVCMTWLKRLSKKNGMALVHDSVEWYSPEEFDLGRHSPIYIEKDDLNRRVIDKQFCVIAISRYLEEHFKSRGIDAVRIPVILDVASIPHEKTVNSERVVFLYTGSPGMKDRLGDMVEAYAMLPEDMLARSEFNIAGCTKQQLIRSFGVSESLIARLEGRLILHGRIPHDKVRELLSKSDFTLLLRHSHLRYAKAGFPTKFVESLASGTPVISNLSSDMGDYFVDGVHGVIADGDSTEAFKMALERAFALTVEEREKMRVDARRLAEDSFDQTKWGQALTTIVDKALSKK